MRARIEGAASSTEQQLGAIAHSVFWIGWIVNGVGALVTFVSVGFLIPIFLDPSQRNEIGLLNAPLIVVVLAIAGVALNRLTARDRARAFAWIVERRQPTDAEHRLTLRLAATWTKRLAISWAVGGLAVCLVNLTYGIGFFLVVTATVWLGGETTCALAYLFFERALRPVTALALAARLPAEPVTPGVRARLLIAWSLGTGVPILGVLVVGLVGVTNSGVGTQYVAGACVFLGAVAMIVGLLATTIAARAIADPVISVRAALDRVAAGDFETVVAIDDSSEVGMLQAGFNRMAEGLRERERIRDLFGRQVGHDVARAALAEGARLGGEEREIGAVFVDLTGSTSMALAMPPTEVVRLLNRFFRVVVDAVEAEGGLVNKFEGDAALCVFGAPAASDDPAGDALRAARRLAARLEREVPEVGFGIGVSAGPAVAGNVGAEHRFEYTVIGDPVNEAARLCELAKQRKEHALASDAALSRACGPEAAAWSVTERTVLRGRLEATGLASPVA
ncbi:MAG: adenylate cyclase [Solirubrobacterales bacterium]|jgi:adenylate cyclase|nr:adenylate cyclase [Solirubrobacterales bacterium]